ncbi:glycosyltransferase [Marine Group I thaumarchaeote]|uniref:Glycosyltransferase n=1 Tax=Marine Group I thaumarchaeote TaxID=2511932 RepID=A0A7K4MXT9_9ARCH|nr:glycosyltransferase [Marine Group I thaumarchaeote]
MDKINYDVLIPARNEELIIEKTLHHLSKQSIKPNLVIVVNDNSNDRTKEIAVSYGAKVIDFPYEHKNWVISGKLGIVFSFGMEYFDKNNSHFMILGADHILPENYIEDIIKNMKKDSVDMASGIIENEVTKSPRGSGRIFTKKAMECIDWKYQSNYGYETYALFKIQSEGMKTLVYPIMTKTQRPTGTNYNKKKFYHMGFSYKALGYTSFYGVGRGLAIAKKYGLYNGLMFSIGFFSNRNVTYNEKIRQYCKKNLEHSWEDLLYNPKQLLKKLTPNE